jgi:hypothetical protein
MEAYLLRKLITDSVFEYKYIIHCVKDMAPANDRICREDPNEALSEQHDKRI